MATEIELKAHVKDSDALKGLLGEKADYLYVFEKEDNYFFPSGFSAHFPSGVRIRSEKRTFPDGQIKTLCFVTYKVKEVRSGIEINDEREFEISTSSGHPSAEFREFLIKLELKPGISKGKRGWAFSHEGITAELVEVGRLGWFLELEVINNEKEREDTFTKEKERLLSFLDDLGIEREAIESRYYSEMLVPKSPVN